MLYFCWCNHSTLGYMYSWVLSAARVVCGGPSLGPVVLVWCFIARFFYQENKTNRVLSDLLNVCTYHNRNVLFKRDGIALDTFWSSFETSAN